jgi:adenine-specific DNA-methyltransferase
MDYVIEYEGVKYYPGGSYEQWYERQNTPPKKKAPTWLWSKEKYENGLTNGEIVFKNGNVYNKVRYDGIAKKPYINIQNIVSQQTAQKALDKLFNERVFDHPKPPELVSWLISLVKGNENALILDFFAGSGTTGHAVMQLNLDDDGTRKYILCTNNENNVCRGVCYERIKKVVEKEDYKASLKYMKIDFVPISDKLYYEYADDLLKHVKELVELENGINFDGNKELSIILTEEELDNFTNNISMECKTIYLGHDVLPTEEQEDLFKKYKIKVNIIPDYYYRDLEG